MTKIYISDYPKITGVKRYYNQGEERFIFDGKQKHVLFFIEILHENSNGDIINNLTTQVDLTADNNNKVYSLTGEYLEYDYSTNPPTVLHTDTKGEPIGEFDFFNSIRGQSIVINDIINNIVSRADNLGYLNKYVE